jgi:hypothetical protein
VNVRLTVLPESDGETGDAVLRAFDLVEELAELDGIHISAESRVEAPGAKGAGDLAGVLAEVAGAGLRALVDFLRHWAARTRRTIEMSIGGDTIKVTGARRDQEDRLIEVWLARHSSST